MQNITAHSAVKQSLFQRPSFKIIKLFSSQNMFSESDDLDYVLEELIHVLLNQTVYTKLTQYFSTFDDRL